MYIPCQQSSVQVLQRSIPGKSYRLSAALPQVLQCDLLKRILSAHLRITSSVGLTLYSTISRIANGRAGGRFPGGDGSTTGMSTPVRKSIQQGEQAERKQNDLHLDISVVDLAVNFDVAKRQWYQYL
jgi:hypothetical protein